MAKKRSSTTEAKKMATNMTVSGKQPQGAGLDHERAKIQMERAVRARRYMASRGIDYTDKDNETAIRGALTAGWVDSEHPRHPAGAPGGKGGEFKSK